MTFYISSENENLKEVFPERQTEKSGIMHGRSVESLQDILRVAEGLSNAFKDDLLSLDDAILSPHTNLEGILARDHWPNQVTRQNLLRLAEELWKLSRECGITFLGTAPSVLDILSRREFNHWAALGRGILETDVDAVELCIAYFQTSPDLIKKTSIHPIAGWVNQGLVIASLSSKTALAFCRATPDFVSADRAFNLRQWAEIVRQILETGKGREAVAIAFISSSIRIVRKITFRELRSWGGAGVKIAANSPGLALTYFSEPPEALSSLYNIEILKFLDLTSFLVDVALGQVIDFYQRCPAELVSLNPKVREHVLDFSRKLAAEGPEDIMDIFDDVVSALSPLFFPIQEKVMESALAISLLSLQASRAYVKSVGFVLNEIPDTFLSDWVEKGLSHLAEDEQSCIGYFSLVSEESKSELVKWKEAVLLEDHMQALSIFAHALSGRKLNLKQCQGNRSEKGISQALYPAIDDKTISLPAFIADEPDRLGNFRLYKVKIAHQAGYVEFGTLDPFFRKIIALLDAFPLRLLARDLFFIIEDGRIDFLLGREYRGLKAEIDQAVVSCIGRRPFPDEDRLGQALEILLRLTLGCLDEGCIPREMRDWTSGLKKAMHGFFENAQCVWDSFQKVSELYESFSPLAAEGLYLPITPMPFQDRPNLNYFSNGNIGADFPEEIEGGETGIHKAVLSMSEEDIKRLLERMNDPKLLQDIEVDSVGEGLFITGLDGLKPVDAVKGLEEEEAGKEPPPFVFAANSGSRQGPFYYDEWDYQQKDYRRKWCTLWEKPVPENASGLYDKIYDNYSDLILKVKKQFMRIRPEVLEVVRQVEWGPEIDFSAMIRSVVDRKVGNSPSDRIFTRKEKKVRRISILLLVDMSASTDRLVSLVDSSGYAPRGLSEKGFHTQSAMTDIQKKIVDVEIESLVVISEALESLGDDYAIFGFSGYGREQVEFFDIKDFDERFSETVKSRICGIQPQRGTRMGPAIRHAVVKLNQMESDHRLLVLLSDGFPQDLDYGEDRNSKAYALHDTMMALAEAKNSDIRPFCITIDLAGDDYLRKMWDPGSYLIVKDVYSLPEVLPGVVESLAL